MGVKRVNEANKKKEVINAPKTTIEAGRKLLYNAADMQVSRDLLLKISQKLDQYIVEYLRKNEYEKES